MLNEAALLTARNDKKLIDAEALDEAIDRVVAGPQKRTRIMSDKEKKITAYHEGGHALVAASLPNSDPICIMRMRHGSSPSPSPTVRRSRAATSRSTISTPSWAAWRPCSPSAAACSTASMSARTTPIAAFRVRWRR